MPADYRIDAQRRLISSAGRGAVTDDDLRGHQARLRSDPAFDPSYDQLWDFSQVTRIEVTSEALRELAGSRSFKAGARRAMVTPSDVGFGLARMFQILHDEAPEELRVFRDLGEARSWLGLE